MPEDDQPALNRGLFGYRRSTVNQIISDRDLMLRQAEGRVRSSQAKIAELEAQLGALRGQNAKREQELRALESRLEDLLQRAQGAIGSGEAFLPEALLHPHDDHAHDDEAEEGEDEEAEPQEGEPNADVLGEYETFGAGGEETSFDYGGSATETSLGEDGGLSEPLLGSDLQFDMAEAAQNDDILAQDEEATEGYGADLEGSMLEEVDVIVVEVDTETFDQDMTESETSDQDMPGFEMSEQEMSEPAMSDIEPSEPQMIDQEEAEMSPPDPATTAAGASTQAPAGMTTSKFVGEEIARIMSAAEESAARIMERARLSTQAQIAEANRLWREVQDEVGRYRAWREEITPEIEAMQVKVDEVRGKIDEVPERIREALAPMADAIAAIDGDLGSLLSSPAPPELNAPSGLEGAEAEWLDDMDMDVDLTEAAGSNGEGVYVSADAEGDPVTSLQEEPEAEEDVTDED